MIGKTQEINVKGLFMKSQRYVTLNLVNEFSETVTFESLISDIFPENL